MSDFTIRENDLLPVLEVTLTDQTGAAVDLTSATSVNFVMTDPTTDTVLVNHAITAVDLAHGVVSYVWRTGDTARVGNFTASFLVTYANGTQTYPTATDLSIAMLAAIIPPAPAIDAWCTVDDVMGTTGQTVDITDVMQAQIIVEGFINRVWRSTDSTHRDFVWLKRAVVYQALFVNQHPEIFSMMDVASLQQDVLSTTFRDEASFYVAPLTQMFCQRLYRAANTTIRMNSAFQKSRRTNTSGSAFGTWTSLS